VADLKNQLSALHPSAAHLGVGDRTSESATLSSASGSYNSSVSPSLSSSRGLPSPTPPPHKSQPPTASLPPISSPPLYPPPQVDYYSSSQSFDSLPPSDLPPEFIDDGYQCGEYQGAGEFDDMPSDLPPMLPPDFQYEEPAFQLTEQELKMLNFASREVRDRFSLLILSSFFFLFNFYFAHFIDYIV
jgi:hypothetical protein